MATNTVAPDLVVQLGEHRGRRFVATQAALREGGQVRLASVHIVARQTGHCRCLETPAFFQQLDLTAMDIDGCVGIGRREFKILAEGFTG
jgi:hypothetical protein